MTRELESSLASCAPTPHSSLDLFFNSITGNLGRASHASLLLHLIVRQWPASHLSASSPSNVFSKALLTMSSSSDLPALLHNTTGPLVITVLLHGAADGLQRPPEVVVVRRGPSKPSPASYSVSPAFPARRSLHTLQGSVLQQAACSRTTVERARQWSTTLMTVKYPNYRTRESSRSPVP